MNIEEIARETISNKDRPVMVVPGWFNYQDSVKLARAVLIMHEALERIEQIDETASGRLSRRILAEVEKL